MNYKVMQRPMFKLGGKAASQGTGITSGLDEKVNYSIGGGVIQGQNMNGREGFEDPRYNSNYFLKSAMDKISKRDAAMDGMANIFVWYLHFHIVNVEKTWISPPTLLNTLSKTKKFWPGL